MANSFRTHYKIGFLVGSAFFDRNHNFMSLGLYVVN